MLCASLVIPTGKFYFLFHANRRITFIARYNTNTHSSPLSTESDELRDGGASGSPCFMIFYLFISIHLLYFIYSGPSVLLLGVYLVGQQRPPTQLSTKTIDSSSCVRWGRTRENNRNRRRTQQLFVIRMRDIFIIVNWFKCVEKLNSFPTHFFFYSLRTLRAMQNRI